MCVRLHANLNEIAKGQTGILCKQRYVTLIARVEKDGAS